VIVMATQQPRYEQAEPGPVAVDGLVRTHWMLAICPGCGHERVHGERHHACCPACGGQLRSFRLYRDLTAGE
jgi:rRNA maturation endonuclease Nob1